MRILFASFGVLIAAVGFQLSSVAGLELESSLWESSVMIYEIARTAPCRNGRLPVLTGIQVNGTVRIYDLQCEDTQDEGENLHRRATPMCTTECNQQCYTPADYNPDPKDCSVLTTRLNEQNTRWDIPVGGIKTWEHDTCTYYFTNQSRDTINFCDSAMASIADKIAWTCGRWLPDPAKGGICTQNAFFVRAVRTPGRPGPSYPITFSNVSPTTSASTSNTEVSTSSASSSPSSSNTGISTGPSNSTKNLQSSSGGSSDTVQPLPGAPSVIFGQQESTSTLGNSTDANVESTPSTKVDIAVAIGASVAGMAVFALAIAGILLYRRFRRRDKLADNHSTALILPTNEVDPDSPWPPVAMYHIPEKRPQPGSPVAVSFSSVSPIEAGTPLNDTDVTSTIVSHGPEYPRPHPRSTEALIAAAAPPNMSREQIDILAANFVSLVRGRHPREETEDGDASDLPPYHHS